MKLGLGTGERASSWNRRRRRRCSPWRAELPALTDWQTASTREARRPRSPRVRRRAPASACFRSLRDTSACPARALGGDRFDDASRACQRRRRRRPPRRDARRNRGRRATQGDARCNSVADSAASRARWRRWRVRRHRRGRRGRALLAFLRCRRRDETPLVVRELGVTQSEPAAPGSKP